MGTDIRGWCTMEASAHWDSGTAFWVRAYARLTTALYGLRFQEEEYEEKGEKAPLRYSCRVLHLSLADFSRRQREVALSSSLSLSLTETGDLLDKERNRTIPRGVEADRVTAYALFMAGYGAPLEEFQGNRASSVRSAAAAFARACEEQPHLLRRQLQRVVNAAGSTAAEFGLGDVTTCSGAHRVPRVTVIQEGRAQAVFCPTACRFSILLAEHYRTDGTCLCDSEEGRRGLRADGYRSRDFETLPLRPSLAKGVFSTPRIHIRRPL